MNKHHKEGLGILTIALASALITALFALIAWRLAGQVQVNNNAQLLPVNVCNRPNPDKCGGESNPKRDYFDAQGNRYDFEGNLVAPVTPEMAEDVTWGK